MAGSYHWLTTGVDTQFNLALPTAQAPAISLPAGAQMKRFLINACQWQDSNNGTGNSDVFDLSLRWTVHFTSGPFTGRTIWTSYRRIPMTQTIFVPITGSSRFSFHAGGDLELGVDQRAIYGKAGGAAATLAFTYSVVATRFATFSNLYGEWTFNAAVLYQL